MLDGVEEVGRRKQMAGRLGQVRRRVVEECSQW